MKNQFSSKVMPTRELAIQTKGFLLRKSEDWQKRAQEEFIGMDKFVKK